MDTDPYRLDDDRLGTRLHKRSRGVLAKVLAVAASAVLLLGAIAVSLIVFAFVLAILLVGGVYLWWKTRDFRKHLRTGAAPDSAVIEGEVVRKNHRPDLQADRESQGK